MMGDKLSPHVKNSVLFMLKANTLTRLRPCAVSLAKTRKRRYCRARNVPERLATVPSALKHAD